MPFDGVVTHAVSNEFKSQLIGGKINKIFLPTKSDLIFMVRNNGANHALLMSVHPSYARVHITNNRPKNPPEPPMFCMVLRKHLTGAILEKIEQVNLERIISFHFKTVNEIGDLAKKTLHMEIMGRHSNIILVNDTNQKIIDCIKHIPPYQNRHRILLPGADYILPPAQNKMNLLTDSAEKMVQKLDFNTGKLDSQLVENIAGISKTAGKEIVHRAHLGSEKIYEQQIEQIQTEIKNGVFYPSIYSGEREDFHVLHMSHIGEGAHFETVNNMLDEFYSNKAERDRVKQQMKDLIRLITNEVNKNRRKLAIHEKTLEKADKRDSLQKQGELLTANLHLVQKGDASVTVVDYYDPEQAEMTIALQTDKTPSENAQQFFKKYRKLSAAKDMAKKEMTKTTMEINYLEDVLVQIDHARDEDIEDIRAELQEEGYIKKQKIKKQKSNKPVPEQFTSSDGTTIYVGRNNKQNEYVTHKLANKNDIWLHTLDIPGSHVIIKSNNPDDATLDEAAQLAAYFSKARQSSAVPVDYTAVKYVKKPSGAKPGFVTYTDQKTLYVTTNKDLINQLQKNNDMEKDS